MVSLPIRLSGRIVEGKGRGTDLGVATANLDIDPSGLLPSGVYAGRGTLSSGCTYKAAISCGNSPYFGDLSRDVIEVHLLDGECVRGDILTIEVLHYIRPQRSDFTSIEELMETIKGDLQFVRDHITV